MTYTAENKLASVTANGETTTFFYDGDGNRVKKEESNGNTTIYVGNHYEVLTVPLPPPAPTNLRATYCGKWLD